MQVDHRTIMPTLILSSRYTDDAQALWRSAVELGWDIERLTNWRVPESLKHVRDPVLYMEGLIGPAVAEQLGLKLVEPSLDWLPPLPDEYRKRWVRLSTMGQSRSSKDPAFIKPPNDKSFPARIYEGHELPIEFPDEMPVLVAEVVDWVKEFRCFILNRRLRTFSVYLREGELQQQRDFAHTQDEEAELTCFMERLLADQRVDLSCACVLDVGTIRGRGWAVVEQNAAWGSGLYGCDPTEVLEVLRHAVEPPENSLVNP
jgi:hypothetical protein